MRTCTVIVLLFAFLQSPLLIAQNLSQANKKFIYESCRFLEFPESEYSAEIFFDRQSYRMGLEHSEMRLIQIHRSDKSMEDRRYQQYYRGIPVYNVHYLLHLRDGKVYASNGSIYPGLQLDINPSITSQQAELYAKRFIQKQQSAQEKKKPETQAHETKMSFHELVITDRRYPQFSGDSRLAYRLILEGVKPLMKREFLIDAQNGEILFSQNKIHAIDRPSIAKTKYYGTQTIISDSVGPHTFVLRDHGRNMTTFTNKHQNLEIFTDQDGFWDQFTPDFDEVGLDAHYAAGKFHDMLLDSLSYRGLDGQGAAINPVVHAEGGSDFLNAYWDGEYAYFGNGDCHHNPLTTLSVVGHEFMHGVTDYNAELIYDGESGALNESYSDIFGKACEYFYDKTRFSWELDPVFKSTKYPADFRSFSDPNRLQMPKAYRGLYWNDDDDIHITSSVMNHWFYLMIEGGQGVNEFGKNYQVRATPMMDVLRILFRCQTAYLTPETDYASMAFYSIKACEDLFGRQSEVYRSMKEAWKAVNVEDGLTTPPQFDEDLAIQIKMDQTQSCELEIEPTIRLYLINQGKSSIAASAYIPFRINYYSDGNNFNEYRSGFSLTEDLDSGEELELIIEKSFKVDFAGRISINVSLSSFDENINNNFDDIDFFNLSPVNGDLYLEYVFFSTVSCSDQKQEVNYIINNISCETIPAGSRLIFHVLGGNQTIHRSDMVLKSDLIPTAYGVLTDSFVLQAKEDIDVFIEMYYQDDPNMDNNVQESLIDQFVIDDYMSFGFEDESFKEYFEEPGFSTLAINNYQGEEFLSSVGLFSGGPDVIYPCLEDKRNFNHEILNSQLHSCLDLSQYENSELSFELIQFHSDSLKYDEFKDKTCMMEISWNNGVQEFSKILSGQQEGHKIQYRFGLPPRFKGDFRLNFYNLYGSGDFFGEPDYDMDVQLLDNLKFSAITSNRDPSDKRMEVHIFPNPAQSEIQILANGGKIDAIKILNVQSQALESVFNPTNKLDISKLAPGIYFLELYIVDGAIIRKSFVKY